MLPLNRKGKIMTWFKYITLLLIIVFSPLSQALPIKTYTDTEKSISVDKETTRFIIKLLSNPTTGYSWFLQYYDKDLISPTGHTYTADNPMLVGAGGSEEWSFVANSQAFTVPRISKLVFIYTRPWNPKDIISTKTFYVVTR
jgi:predicted secreted protein